MTAELAMRRRRARAGETGLFPIDDVAADTLSHIPDDQDVLVTARTHHSLWHLRYMWGLASLVAQACDSLHDREDAMDLLKLKAHHCRLVVSPSGSVYPVPRSLTELDGEGIERLRRRFIWITVSDILPGVPESDITREIDRMLAPAMQYERAA